MDNNFSEKLNKVLSDPESMQKIMALAGSLSGEQGHVPDQAQQEQSSAPSALGDTVKKIMESPVAQAFFDGEAERLRLLKALSPYMGDQKRQRLDKVISLMESMDSLGSLSKLM